MLKRSLWKAIFLLVNCDTLNECKIDLVSVFKQSQSVFPSTENWIFHLWWLWSYEALKKSHSTKFKPRTYSLLFYVVLLGFVDNKKTMRGLSLRDFTNLKGDLDISISHFRRVEENKTNLRKATVRLSFTNIWSEEISQQLIMSRPSQWEPFTRRQHNGLPQCNRN